MLIPSRDTLTDTPRNTNIWASCDPVKLTHKINHHISIAPYCPTGSGYSSKPLTSRYFKANGRHTSLGTYKYDKLPTKVMTVASSVPPSVSIWAGMYPLASPLLNTLPKTYWELSWDLPPYSSWCDGGGSCPVFYEKGGKSHKSFLSHHNSDSFFFSPPQSFAFMNWETWSR